MQWNGRINFAYNVVAAFPNRTFFENDHRFLRNIEILKARRKKTILSKNEKSLGFVRDENNSGFEI